MGSARRRDLVHQGARLAVFAYAVALVFSFVLIVLLAFILFLTFVLVLVPRGRRRTEGEIVDQIVAVGIGRRPPQRLVAELPQQLVAAAAGVVVEESLLKPTLVSGSRLVKSIASKNP